MTRGDPRVNFTERGFARELRQMRREIDDLQRRTGAVAFSQSQPAVWGKTAFMRRSTDQTVPNAGAASYPTGYTRVGFDTTERDDLGVIDLTNNRMVFIEKGVYVLTANISWKSNSTGNRSMIIGLNSSVLTGSSVAGLGSGWTTNHSAITVAELDVGDIVVLDLLQNSGGDLDIEASGLQPHLTATLLLAD